MIRLTWFVFALAALLWSGSARAHDPFELTAIVHVRSDAVVVATTMNRATALRLTGGAKSPRATFPPEAFAEHAASIEALGPTLFELRSGERAASSKGVRATLTNDDDKDVEIVATYEPLVPGRITLHARHLSALSEGYTSAITVKTDSPKGTRFKLLTATDPEFAFNAGSANGDATFRSPEPETTGAELRRFVLLGVEHVLTGYDHLLFLIGVLVACRAVGGMLWLVSCFTLAHSITLALATFGQVSAPASVVEPLIAASIVFVGVENLGKEPRLSRRMIVTFLFGLIHGLGFAAVLRELEVPREALATTLIAFNVGVELGQLAVAAVVLPLLLRMHGSPRGTQGLRYASVLLSAAGGFWFCERLLAA